ncbi:hypothetical protein ACFQ6U_29000 [Streptomyces sp. NPDC056465]
MRVVTGYARRHVEQRPDGDVHNTRRRHSLMNWAMPPRVERSARR